MLGGGWKKESWAAAGIQGSCPPPPPLPLQGSQPCLGRSPTLLPSAQ